MAFLYSVHSLGTPHQGNLPPAPVLPPLGGELDLAEETDSDDIVAPARGAIIIMRSDVDAQVQVLPKADAAALDPATSVAVIDAGKATPWSVGEGTWTLQWIERS